MQVQAVVASPPWLCKTLTLLQNGGVYAALPQHRGSREPRWAGADDDDLIHLQKATAEIMALGVKVCCGPLCEVDRK